jgi:hypothetical protein
MRYGEDTDRWMEYEAEEEELANRRADADAEMASMERAGNAMARAERAGRCSHGSAQGYMPGNSHGLKRGQLKCTNGCGAVFANDEAWYQAMDDAVRGF